MEEAKNFINNISEKTGVETTDPVRFGISGISNLLLEA
jgi:uncharacterized NAD-dependent epimerase/dehydratase family protein